MALPTKWHRPALGWAAIAGLSVLVGVALWKVGGRWPGIASVEIRPKGIMGTEATLVALVPPVDVEKGHRALREAEASLRRVEALMSVHLTSSEVSRLNAAHSGEKVPLSAQTLSVLAAARAACKETGGAFDATCRPLIQLWKRSGSRGCLPDPAEVALARAASAWDHFRLSGDGAVKSADSACVDLGGIAKGYGIDRAVEALASAGCSAGLVNIGGDLRCFGAGPSGKGWEIDIRNPFGKGMWGALLLGDGAVCTSGNYARFVTVAGRRYSHILNPQTGVPADAVPSVTVIAPAAVTADVWATALSVLGAEGLKRLPEGQGIEAMVVLGVPDRHEVHATAGFARFLKAFPPGLEVRWTERKK